MKAYEWDLSFLYTSFSSKEFLDDFNKLKAMCKNLIDKFYFWNNNTKYLKEVFDEIERLLKLHSEIYSYINLNLLINCNDTQAKMYYEEMLDIQSSINDIKTTLYNKINIDDNIDNIDINDFGEYKYLFQDIRVTRKHLMPPEIEKVVSSLRKSGSYAWQSLRDYIDGNAMIEACIGGESKVFSLYEIRNMATNSDESIRKEAFDAEIKIYKKIESYSAACFNGIKGDAVSVYKLREFNSVLDNMLFINKMDRKTLEIMNSTIEEYLPYFHKYYKRKAKLLNKDKMCYYDLLAPLGDNVKKYTFEDAHSLLVNTFSSINEELSNFIDKAFKENWFDVYPREGKVGGALCADLPTKNCSRIFLNFNGSFSNIRTCAHELGHAYHGQFINHLPLLLRDAPTPICESASIFNETIFQQKILEYQEDKLSMLDASIMESAQTIVDIYSRFLFEDKAIKIRESRSLTTDEIIDIMYEAQSKAYGDSIDKKYLHPYMWICKPHYYITDYHYYNFPYIFGLLFSKGLYALYEEDKINFFEKYKNFLSNTCNGNISEIVSPLGIDIHNKSFWKKSLDVIIKDIDLFLELTK